MKLRFDTFDASSTPLIMAVSERLVALCVSDSHQSAVASATLCSGALPPGQICPYFRTEISQTVSSREGQYPACLPVRGVVAKV